MTHEYTLLVGAVVLPGGGEPEAEAIAWAFDTVLAIDTETAVRAISRGDSRVISLPGAFVVPIGPDGGSARGQAPGSWPIDAHLEIGGPANFAVLDRDPRAAAVAGLPRILAIVHGGRMVEGTMPEVPHTHER